MISGICSKTPGFVFAWVLISRLVAGGDDSKIVGGFTVELKNVPFAASLQYKGMHFCGGALLTLSHVLSGCHCLTLVEQGMKHEDVPIRHTQDLTVMVGAENLFESSDYLQFQDIAEIKIHPQCSFVQIMVYDFAVAYLKTPFKENMKVRPFEMFAFNKEEYAQKTKSLVGNDTAFCYVAGWGATDPEDLKANAFIKAARMRLITNEACQKLLGQENDKFVVHNFEESAMICSLSHGYHKNESDCAGDSGGPFFCGSVVYGIVSFGYDCGHWDSPNVYATISHAVDWLVSLEIFPRYAAKPRNRSLVKSRADEQRRSGAAILMALQGLLVAINGW